MAKRPRSNRTEHRMAEKLDELAAYEEFCEAILPELRKALKAGKSADDIYKAFSAHAAARTVSIALKEIDSTKALAASRDILDRAQGKAKERVETTHKYEKLKDEELDSLLLSELSASEAPDDDEATH